MGYDDYGYGSFNKDNFYKESLAFTIKSPKAHAVISGVTDSSPHMPPAPGPKPSSFIPTVAMFDYEFRAILARGLTDAPAEDALAIYDTVIPGAEFCMGTHRYNETAGYVATIDPRLTDYVLKCPGEHAFADDGTRRENRYARRMDDAFYAAIGVDPDDPANFNESGRRQTYKVLIKASANETVPLIYRDSNRPRPQFVASVAGQVEYATEIELLDFANRLRRLGGANVIDAFMPSVAGSAKHCLIANALNFSALVSPCVPGNGRWQMNFPDNVSTETIDRIANALGLARYGTGLILPQLVGNAANAFDQAPNGWVTKYRTNG